MNILTQLVQTSGKKAQTLEGAAKGTSQEGKKQGMGQKFARLMMGFLGMNVEAKIPADGEAKSSENQKGQSQLINLPGQKVQEKQGQPGFFIGSHFVPMKQVQAENTSGGNVTSSKEKTSSILKDKVSGKAQTLPIQFVGGQGKAPSVKTEAQPLSESAETNTKAPEQTKTKDKALDILKTTTRNATEGQTETKTTAAEAGKKDGKTAPKQTGQAQTISGASQKEISAQVQKLMKNFPGATVAAKGQAAGKTVEEQMSLLKSQGKPMQELRQALKEMMNGKQKSKSAGLSNGSQANAAGQKSSQSSSASTSGQKHPALKHLMNQVEEKGNTAKTKLMNQNQQAAESSKGQTSQAASKSAFTNVAQSFAASQSDKTLFKPIQQNSTTFKLDPSQLIKMKNSGGGEVEMELQAQADKDTSSNEEGKTSVRMNGTSFSQLSKTSGRREFSAQLVRQLQQQSGSSKSNAAKSWSHHRFVLDDGKSVHVSVRQADGAMQLQLSAGNSELNKIIQQHIDEIRQHLQEQMDVEIDLQLQQFGGQEAGEESEGSQNNSQMSGNGANVPGQRDGSEEASTRTARYLGFNNNEWTA